MDMEIDKLLEPLVGNSFRIIDLQKRGSLSFLTLVFDDGYSMEFDITNGFWLLTPDERYKVAGA